VITALRASPFSVIFRSSSIDLRQPALKALVGSEVYHVIIRARIRVNRMGSPLEGKYARRESVAARGSCGGGLLSVASV
jgi:hypothetical protein